MADAADPVPLVLVTGVSGYIGSCLLKRLLEDGHYRVRGTVRDVNNEKKTRPIRELVPDAKYPVELVSADLSKDEGWREAVEGCTYVLHTASPLPVSKGTVANRQTLVDGPQEGAKRIFKAIVEAGCVKRVVMTSSTAATLNEGKDGSVLTEEDWTDMNLVTDLYAIGKTLAEKEAWKVHDNLPEEQRFELVTLLPCVVIGPNVLPEAYSTNVFLKELLEGTMPLIPKFTIPTVDVRDVVDAHILAMTHDEAPGNRFYVCGEILKLTTIADILREEFTQHGYSVPASTMPDWLTRFISWFWKDLRLAVASFMGEQKIFCGDKIKEQLDFKLRPARDMIIDGGYTMIEAGSIVRKAQYSGQPGKSSSGDSSDKPDE